MRIECLSGIVCNSAQHSNSPVTALGMYYMKSSYCNSLVFILRSNQTSLSAAQSTQLKLKCGCCC